MGIYQRENGIFYLQVHAYSNHTDNNVSSNKKSKYKRISLGTRDYRLAQRMYDNYLLSEITSKIKPTQSTYQEQTNQIVKQVSKREIKKHSIEKCYTEYLDLCESQKLSKGVI